MLQDISNYKKDMQELKNKEKEKKKGKEKQDREKGLEMRAAALSGMASKSLAEISYHVFVPPIVDKKDLYIWSCMDC